MKNVRGSLTLTSLLVFLMVSSFRAFPYQEPQTIKINPREAGVVDLEELADSIAVLKLENTEESFFGYSPNILMTETRVFMNTGIGYKPGKVFVFDRNGKFIFKVEAGGNGPEEVDRITNMAVDGEDLLVYGDLAHKVLRYSPEGKLLEVYKVDFYASNFVKISDQWIFNLQGYSRSEHEGAKFMANSLNFKQQAAFFKPEETGFIDASSYRYFYPFQDHALFTLPLTDTIFSVSKNEVTPQYFIDFGKYKIKKELREGPYRRSLFEMMAKANYAELKKGLMRSDDLLGFGYVRSNRGANKEKAVRYFYYDLKEEKAIWHYYRLTLSRFGARLRLFPNTYKGQTFVSETFQGLFEYNEEELNNPEREGTSKGYGLMSLDEAMAVMRVEDNPYLFIYTVKKD